ncbi:TIGR03089 family protein [Glutamicibacter sp. NPDC087344]|uniref:TIGR03089 family protein n=1 Tax=Glutamicibacter sp. NPDC087344 TaxID=3363994 RepID=UPI00380DA1FE
MNSGTFVEQLLAPHRASASPWLTWYGASGERIELSGRVFDNWVAKSANLLAEIFDLEQGQVVVIDLPTHWKSLVLALAALHHGATLLPADHPDASEAVLWMTQNPADPAIPGTAEILAVNPAALALSFGAELGPVAEDFNASVRSFADQFYPSSVDGSVVAVAGLSLQELFAAKAQAKGTILVRASVPLADFLSYAVAQWAAGDALVLLEDGVQDTERLRQGERITSDYNPEP